MNQEKKLLNCSQVVVKVRYTLDSSSTNALTKLSQDAFQKKVQKDYALILSHKIFSTEKR